MAITKEEIKKLPSQAQYKEKRKALNRELKKKGFEVMRSFSDHYARITRKAIEIARREDPSNPRLHMLDWVDMTKYKDELLRMIRKYFKDAEFDYYRGVDHWFVRYTFRVRND
jgi:hypothetical protein